jgi:hypothetical protein
VRVIDTNEPAARFWRKVIAEYTSGRYDEIVFDSDAWKGPVFTFNNHH